MVLKLVKTDRVEADGRGYEVRYYERRTARGTARYSGEVLLGTTDRIILDDDSLPSLESRIARLGQSTVLTRAMRDAERRMLK